MDSLKICVMGLGYIGLPTASLLATRGHKVLGVDVNPRVVETINRGDIHIVEPDLDVLVRSAVHSGNLKASLEPVEADVFILAVPTPHHHDDHRPDVSYVEAATRTVAPYVRPGNLVILESTSPVGTTETVARILAEVNPELVKNGKRACYVAHCPERVLPGRILYELVENHRVVGGIDRASTDKAVAFYQGVVKGEVFGTDCRTAEMCKLVENSFRDVNIAFANELSIICHKIGINVRELIGLANKHPRVNILSPGPGVGGHCIAVDPWFVVWAAPEEARLIRTARQVNDGKKDWVVDRIREKARRFRDPVIACLGLAYKNDVDDLRESPALDITRALRAEFGDAVLAVEPYVKEFEEFPLSSLETALEKADIVVALVAHKDFVRLDSERLKDKIVIDTCGAFK
jgi:UDP-N-acetyl-D-mannosaminuronic acid dehydrogenase